ncbi:Scavenger receptor cysteine-rich type 1 M130 [Paramuricea clavata]|uniref:Scavenger receptor cysteine-rich type 1 M130 n=1 Tax=Paramuricea clavata TaxID=317549 RepID=A0A7D9J7B6_PARCT|nr:Scavenger receptor cysteine-rich type 1 M130 [Paramuricea clavata]
MASLCIETINKLRVVDLRTELEKRGLSRSGRKDILIDRLKMSLLEDENKNKSSELADHGEATELDKTTKASEQPSESACRKELLVEDTYESNKPADHGKADELSNTWKAPVMHNTEADGSRLEGLIKDLMRLIDDKLPQQVVANVTADQPAALDHNLSIEMAEVKLELAMLWATVNSNQDKCIQSKDKAPSTQSQSPSYKNAGTQTVEREFSVKPSCHRTTKSSIDFKNQLDSYRATHKANFESQNTQRDQGKTSKSKNSKQPNENNKVSELRQKIKKVEQERESLKTIIQIQKEEFRQALNSKDDNKTQRPWHVIKPKPIINPKNKQIEREDGKQSRKPGPVSTSNKYESLEDEIIDVDEVANEIGEATNDIISEHNKETESLNKSNIKRHNPVKSSTVVIGDSLLKGLRQHSITKATNTKVQVKCFPGAKLSDMKHYSIPSLAIDPKHVILHCGTNDLQKKNPQEITKETGELCDLILANCPNTDITVSSILTRKDNQGNKIAEVNDQLRLLCLEKNLKFLLHANIDNKCLNRSGLHLNKLGDSILAKNIIGAIKCF